MRYSFTGFRRSNEFFRTSFGKLHPGPLVPAHPFQPNTVTIIVNPVSGRGLARGRVEEITRLAAGLGWTGDIVITTEEQGADYLSEQAIKKGHTHIIICGGDGSIMQALTVILSHPQVKIGIVPVGTGNVLARNLGLPTNLHSALEVALYGDPHFLDVGKVNDRQFFSSIVGIGWDAAVIRDTRRDLKDRFGLGAYFLAAIKNLGHPAAYYSVAVDGAPPIQVKAKSVLVANVGYLAPGIQAIPNARPDSGFLQIAVVGTETLLSWAVLCANILLRRLHKDPRYLLLQGKNIEITSMTGPQPYEVDGNDFQPVNKLHINVLPAAISVMLPRK